MDDRLSISSRNKRYEEELMAMDSGMSQTNVEAHMRNTDRHSEYDSDTGAEGLTGGDFAIGEEKLQHDLTIADVKKEQTLQEGMYGFKRPELEYHRLLACACVGSLFGTVLMLLAFHSKANSDYFQKSMYGCFSGAFAGLIGVLFYTVYKQIKWEYRADPFKKDLASRRAALRRMEQEAVERHDEFIYYDSDREYSRCHRILCCPHYGKITSRRIIYSIPDHTVSERLGEMSADEKHRREKELNDDCSAQCTCRWLRYIFLSPYYALRWCYRTILMIPKLWSQKIESVNYTSLADISMDQTCINYAMGTGQIVLHLAGEMDPSTQAEEQARIYDAISRRDLVNLKQSEIELRDLPEYSPLYQDLLQAREVIAEIEHDEREKAESEGRVWTPTRAKPRLGTSDLQTVTVYSVTGPNSVMDDLSYRIATKNFRPQRAQGLPPNEDPLPNGGSDTYREDPHRMPQRSPSVDHGRKNMSPPRGGSQRSRR